MIHRYHFERTLGLGALLAAAITILCLSGCATFGGGSMTTPQKAALLRAGTLTATSVGLAQIEDETERSTIAGNIVMVTERVVAVLDGGQVQFTGEHILDLLVAITPPEDIAGIPPEARAAVIAAVDVLLSQVTIPEPDELVDPDTLALVRAAVDGIRAGAQVHVKSPIAFMLPTGEIIIVEPTPEEGP
jgi:hypothetical protein